MKINRKWHNLVLDGDTIEDLEDLQYALENEVTAKLLGELFDLYQKGTLQLWLRSHDGEYEADELDQLTLSGDIVKKLYDICYCLDSDVEEEDIVDAVVDDLVLDGEEISDIEELVEHPSTELLDLFRKGTLQLWLRYNDGEEEADKLENLTLSGDMAKDLLAVCQAVGIVITLEDIIDAINEENCSQGNRINLKKGTV